MNGRLAIVLHAHLPFVRHPEYPSYLEEDWLFEAITETYLPLLEVYEGLWRDGIDFRVSMTMTPPLIGMLDDPMLRDRYQAHLSQLIALADEECGRREGGKLHLAHYYRDLFQRRHDQYQRYGCDLVSAFRTFVERGRLEVLTCGATHGFLPLMQEVPEAIHAQLAVAVAQHTTRFGQAPRGIWLPECGWFPGLDQAMREVGLRWFISESKTVLHATPRPVFGVYAPLYTPAGVGVFPRDPETSSQVWSASSGYPGHVDYREFHRDLGYDAPFDDVAPYVQPTGLRKNVGIKYHRITGKTEDKELYDPERARQVAAEHAADFVSNRRAQARFLREVMGREAVIVAPYDAELFGHWWYEGPLFLDFVFRKIACDCDDIVLDTPQGCLEAQPEQQVAQPHFSSWGANSYASVWLDSSNEWMYPHLLASAKRMVALAQRYPDAQGVYKRALNQSARELLLAQSSDWAFIVQTDTSVEYAERRTYEHLARFHRLATDLEGGVVDEAMLHAIEQRDTLFPHIDYRVYRGG